VGGIKEDQNELDYVDSEQDADRVQRRVSNPGKVGPVVEVECKGESLRECGTEKPYEHVVVRKEESEA
jgi:hypothetical protein